MSKKYAIGTSLSSSETLSGIIYLAVQLFMLPTVLYWINAQAGNALNEAEINFMFYLINFISMLVIFRNFLSNSLQQLTRHPIIVLESVILGLVAYYACTFCTTQIIALLSPGYANYNDEAIFAMSQGNTFLLTVCTVVLVPPLKNACTGVSSSAISTARTSILPIPCPPSCLPLSIFWATSACIPPWNWLWPFCSTCPQVCAWPGATQELRPFSPPFSCTLPSTI